MKILITLSRTRILVRGLLLTISLTGFFSDHAQADEEKWQYVGKTDNGKFLLYIDPKSVSYSSENTVRVRVKKEISREAFDESVRRAEEGSGAKVEDPDTLFKVIVKSEAKEYEYEIHCRQNKYMIHMPSRSSIHFIQEYPIIPDSTEEHIQKMLCKVTIQ